LTAYERADISDWLLGCNVSPLNCCPSQATCVQDSPVSNKWQIPQRQALHCRSL